VTSPQSDKPPAAPETPATPPTPKKGKWSWSLILFLAVIASPFLLMAGMSCHFLVFGPTITRSDSRADLGTLSWLPDSARDISYYRATGFFILFAMYNQDMACLLSEAEFTKLADAKGWPLVEHKNGFDSPLRVDFHNLPPRYAERYDESAPVLVYNNRGSNGGGLTVVYQPSTELLYATASNR